MAAIIAATVLFVTTVYSIFFKVSTPHEKNRFLPTRYGWVLLAFSLFAFGVSLMEGVNKSARIVSF